MKYRPTGDGAGSSASSRITSTSTATATADGASTDGCAALSVTARPSSVSALPMSSR